MSEVKRESGRRVSLITAAASLERLFVGIAANMMNIVPVARAADSAKVGSGKVILSSDDPLVLLGVNGTKFTKQAVKRGMIQLGKDMNFSSAAIDTVVSDTEIR